MWNFGTSGSLKAAKSFPFGCKFDLESDRKSESKEALESFFKVVKVLHRELDA